MAMFKKSIALLLTLALFFSAVQLSAVSADENGLEVTFHPVTFNLNGKVTSGENGFYFNGKKYVPLALIHKGTTYVPLRFVSESLGKAVHWDPAIRTIFITDTENQPVVLRGDGSLPNLAPGEKMVIPNLTVNYRFVFNGVRYNAGEHEGRYNNGTSDVPLSIFYQNTTYVPMRYMAESLDKKVSWDPQTRTISISDILLDSHVSDDRNLTMWMERPSYIYSLRNVPIGPRQAYDAYREFMVLHIMEGLMRLGEDRQPEPGMANKVEVSENGRVYTFHLRDAAWNDGSPVTASDFKYGWIEGINDPGISYLFEMIEGVDEYISGEGSMNDIGIDTPDEKTLKVTLAHPDPGFLSLVTNPAFYPEKQKVDEEEENYWVAPEDLLQNGPFVIDYMGHEAVYLKKNEHYWNHEQVYLETISLKLGVNTEEFLQAFDRKQYDLAGFLYPDDEQALRQHSDYMKVNRPVMFYTLLNHESTLFSNAKLRRAVAHLMNQTELAEKLGTVPLKGHIPFGVKGEKTAYHLENPPKLLDYDVEQARKLISEAKRELGVTELPHVQLVVSESSLVGNANIIVDHVINGLEQGGFTVDLIPVSNRELYNQYREGNFDMGLTGWGFDYDNPLNYLELFQSGASMGWSHYTNRSYDQLLQKAYEEIDMSERIKIIHSLEQHLIDQTVNIPLYTRDLHLLKQKNVKGIRYPFSVNTVDLSRAYKVDDE
ncbi:MAG: hypothetical protein H0Z33_04175 [Bacillaceae bacterium]|nr:hypothetical protein [Bacillaceae bacterium]